MKITSYKISEKSVKKNLFNDALPPTCLVIVRSSDEKTKFYEFILKILKSIGITDTEHFGLITPDEFSKIRYNVIQNTHKCLFLVFGPSPDDLHFQINHLGYELLTIKNLTFLFTDPLDAVESDRKLKVDLWNALKPLIEE